LQKGEIMFKTLTASLLLSAAATALAQIPAPIVPEQIIYRHWPEQFVQWIGPELPYTMIELYVDPATGPSPLYEAVLTERATNKRIHYTNQQQMLEIDKHGGADAYLTTMQLDRPANAGVGATYLLRFVDHEGQPVSWQFVQGSDISERGGGISPAGDTPPVLMFRERSAVAGEGAALKVGNKVSVADVWTEISQPPYFVAYRGAMSQNVDIAVFAGAGQEWKTVTAPKSLDAGAEWSLQSADSVSRTLKIKEVHGEHVTVLDRDQHFPGRAVVLEATFSNGAWAFDKMHYTVEDAADANQGLTLTFAPAASAQPADVKFEVIAGRKTRIAGGTVAVDAKQQLVHWQFKDPQWLRGKDASTKSATVDAGAGTQTASR
jgi:hypothetical protein